jgi:hypothetical protein
VPNNVPLVHRGGNVFVILIIFIGAVDFVESVDSVGNPLRSLARGR